MQVNESGMKALISIRNKHSSAGIMKSERNIRITWDTWSYWQKLFDGWVFALIAKAFQMQCLQNRSTQRATEPVKCIRFRIINWTFCSIYWQRNLKSRTYPRNAVDTIPGWNVHLINCTWIFMQISFLRLSTYKHN